MKPTIVKYGGYGLLTGMILFLAVLSLGNGLSYSTQEILGYATMIASLSFIFFGIRHYRDSVNNGKVSLGKAIVIGVLISILVGIGVGITDYIYTTLVHPDFATDYLEHTLQTMEASMSTEEFQIKKPEFIQQMKDYGGSGFMAFLMFFTVLLIGFIMAIISGLILQRK